MPETTTIEILDFGEDGDWYAAEGHHDLTAFMTAVGEYLRELFGDYADDVSTWSDEAKHTWYRPVLLEDCRKDVDAWHPGRRAVERLGLAEQLYESRVAEGWVYPCDSDYPGAEAWTEIRQ
jgi:hypothetical protein